MATVKKARLFLRRGTDTDRKTSVLCSGELGYSTDAFRVFIGDGATLGGNPVGITSFMSAGSAFHTDLVEASAAGYAFKGDFALFPSKTYLNLTNTQITPPTGFAVAMVLTGEDGASNAQSWVALNSGIPFGNIVVGDDEISADKIHGGTFSGDINFEMSSATTKLSSLSVSHLTAFNATISGAGGSGHRYVLSDADGKLCNSAETYSTGTNGVQWLTTYHTITSVPASTPTLVQPDLDHEYTLPAGVPSSATSVLLAGQWVRHDRLSGVGILYAGDVHAHFIIAQAYIAKDENAAAAFQAWIPIGASKKIKIKYNDKWAKLANNSSSQWSLSAVGWM